MAEAKLPANRRLGNNLVTQVTHPECQGTYGYLAVLTLI